MPRGLNHPFHESVPTPPPRPPSAAAFRLPLPHFLVLCLVMGALPYAGQLVAAARELHLHPAMVACIVLAVAGLFHWAVHSLNFLVARRQAEEEPKPQPRPAATTAAPTGSASRLAHPHFLVLCLVVGALPYAEQLVAAAGELHLHPAMVASIVLAVAGLFDWAVLSLNFLVARRQAEEEPKPQPPLLPFLVLALAIAAAMIAGPAVAAEAIHPPPPRTPPFGPVWRSPCPSTSLLARSTASSLIARRPPWPVRSHGRGPKHLVGSSLPWPPPSPSE